MNAEFADLFKLGRAERLQLVEDLWDSIATENAPMPVSDEKHAELRLRKSVSTNTQRPAGRGSKLRNGLARSMIEHVTFTPEADEDVDGVYQWY